MKKHLCGLAIILLICAALFALPVFAADVAKNESTTRSMQRLRNQTMVTPSRCWTTWKPQTLKARAATPIGR